MPDLNSPSAALAQALKLTLQIAADANLLSDTEKALFDTLEQDAKDDQTATEIAGLVANWRGQGTETLQAALTALQAGAGPAPDSLTIDTFGPQAVDGAVPVAYTRVGAAQEYEVYEYADTTSAPTTVAELGGAGFTQRANVTLSTGSASITHTASADLEELMRLAFVPVGGGDSDIVLTPNATFIDTTDTVISPFAWVAGSGVGEVDFSFTPDEAGTYRVSIYASGATPTNQEIEDGTGAIATATGAGVAATQEAGTLSAADGQSLVAYIFFNDGSGQEVIVGPTAVTAGASAPPPGPTASVVSFGPQQSDGTVPIRLTDLSEDAQVLYAITSSDQSAATAAAVETAAEGGASLTDQIDFDSFAGTVGGGPYSRPIASNLDSEESYLQVVLRASGGGLSQVYTAGPISIDTTPAVLNASAAAVPSSTNIALSLTSDKDGTFIFRRWADGTDPSDAQIESGAGALESVAGSASASFEELAAFTGGDASTTYQTTVFFLSSVGQKTFVTLPDVTTDAGAFFSDDFERADEALTDSNGWILALGSNAGNIVDGAVVLPASTDTTVRAYLPTVLPENQFARVTCKAMPTGTQDTMGVIVRRAQRGEPTATTYYALDHRNAGSTGRARIYRYQGTVATQIGDSGGGAGVLVAGAQVELRAEGSTISAYFRAADTDPWTQTLSVTDTVVTGGGQAGINLQGEAAIGDIAIEDVLVGEIAA